jgi:hypothetical protein
MVKTPQLKCVLTHVDAKITANAMCEWNGQDNKSCHAVAVRAIVYTSSAKIF